MFKISSKNINRHPHPGGHPGGGAPAGSGKWDMATVTDLSEKGAGGASCDKRLYMQLLVFGGAIDSTILIDALKQADFQSVLYEDLNDPTGVALLTMDPDPEFFVTILRKFLKEEPFDSLYLKEDMTMTGRSYAIGHEENLEDWLTQKWKRSALNPDMNWAIWYPLRRTGEFYALDGRKQGEILREHGMIGRAFGESGLATDVRLASFGLDKNDNDFTIGLIGSDLLPLSKLVQIMRKTEQTSRYIDSLGPFFVGKSVYKSSL